MKPLFEIPELVTLDGQKVTGKTALPNGRLSCGTPTDVCSTGCSTGNRPINQLNQ